MRHGFKIALAAAGLIAASTASANLVDFNGLPTGLIANPYSEAGATFSGPGFNYVSLGGLCQSASSANPANCANLLQVDFSGTASNISFTFWGNNNHTVGADIGDAQVFSGATLLGIVDLLVLDATSGPGSADLVSLTGYANVTRLVVSSTDFGGVLYDDFSFTLTAAPQGLPEPAALMTLALAFGAAGTAMRRRKPAACGS